jgi:hypothetical protein
MLPISDVWDFVTPEAFRTVPIRSKPRKGPRSGRRLQATLELEKSAPARRRVVLVRLLHVSCCFSPFSFPAAGIANSSRRLALNLKIQHLPPKFRHPTQPIGLLVRMSWKYRFTIIHSRTFWFRSIWMAAYLWSIPEVCMLKEGPSTISGLSWHEWQKYRPSE